MKEVLAVIVGVAMVSTLLTDAEKFAQAFYRYENNKTPVNALRLAFAGFEVVKDTEALGTA